MKRVAITLGFIVAIGVIAYLGVLIAGPKVLVATASNNLDIAESGATYHLPIPTAWSYEYGPTKQNAYIYDERHKLVAFVRFYQFEGGTYPYIDAQIGNVQSTIGNFEVMSHINPDNAEEGFIVYKWKGTVESKTDSIEVTIPFQKGLFARSSEETTSKTGTSVRFADMNSFLTEKVAIDQIISHINK